MTVHGHLPSYSHQVVLDEEEGVGMGLDKEMTPTPTHRPPYNVVLVIDRKDDEFEVVLKLIHLCC
jgi:hypothetical protein